MDTPTIFTIFLKPYDPESPNADRIEKILAGNQEVRCSQATIDFSAGAVDTLVLRIPLRYVNITFQDKEDM